MEIESAVSSPHVTGEQLDRLRDGSLPPATVAEVGGHAATCQACGRAVADALSLPRMTRDLRIQLEAAHEPAHLSGDELMAYADGTSRDDAHLKECEICCAELDEILRFKDAMRPRPRRPWVPFAIAASLAAIALSIPLLDRAPRTPSMPPHQSTSSIVVLPPPPPLAVATGHGRPEWDTWVANVQARRALPLPAIIAELRPQKTRLRGAAEEDDLRLSPDQTVVAGPRPRFQWAARPGASYNVILRDGDAIIESGALTDPRWTPPRDLTRGREYQWQIELTIDGERSIYPKAPDPPARFRVLAQSALDEIADTRKREPDDALLQAVILARHGLRDETLTALDRLGRTDATLAEDLRDSIRRW